MRCQIFVTEAFVVLWQALALKPKLNSDTDLLTLP